MNSTKSALDMLMKKVTSMVATLFSIQMDVAEHSLPATCGGPTMATVYKKIRDLRNELQSALREAHLALTTEPPTSGKTKSKPISNGTLEVIVALVTQIAANTSTIVSLMQELAKELKTGDDGWDGCEKSDEKTHSDEHTSCKVVYMDGSCVTCGARR